MVEDYRSFAHLLQENIFITNKLSEIVSPELMTRQVRLFKREIISSAFLLGKYNP